jgi:hypothetical protein
MNTVRAPRPAFTPEALATLDHTMDEVWKELINHGALSPLIHDASDVRAKMARRLIGFASSGWSVTQIKQLLLRALRNEQWAAWSRNGRRRMM